MRRCFVLLYTEVSFPPLPSFPPFAPSVPRVAAEGLPKVSPPTTRPGCVLYPVRTLLSPGLSSETETRGLVLSLARSLATRRFYGEAGLCLLE